MNQPPQAASSADVENSFETAKQNFLTGVAHFEAGQFDAAKTAFESSLALVPNRASTLNNLGATHLKLGQPALALRLLDQALAMEPDEVDAWCHRGDALAALSRPLDALASFDQALALLPSHMPALYQRSLLLCGLQRYPEALLATGQLLALDAANQSAWWVHADVLNRLGRLDDALTAYDQLLALNPTLARAASQRGGLLKDLGRNPEAIRAFEQALALGGDAELNGYFLASLTSQSASTARHPAPQTAPRSYVESLFDDYADQFDTHLVGLLGYRAHIVLVEELLRLKQAEGRSFESALDLGCGTGLCGPLVKSRTSRLEGVDLSALMLEKARATGAYDHLAHADLSDHLKQAALAGSRHDLVLSADVFIYVGALEAVFAGVYQAMAPGGIFCFSVESAADAVDYALTPGLRYAHSARYLRQLAASTGFAELAMLAHPIRHEQRRAIDGLFVYFLKPV